MPTERSLAATAAATTSREEWERRQQIAGRCQGRKDGRKDGKNTNVERYAARSARRFITRLYVRPAVARYEERKQFVLVMFVFSWLLLLQRQSITRRLCRATSTVALHYIILRWPLVIYARPKCGKVMRVLTEV